MKRWLIILSATYPDGSLGSVVTQVLSAASIQDIGHNDDTLGSILTDVVAYYHRMVGPAYSYDDFCYTLWEADSLEDLYELAGERILATDGIVPEAERPIAIGPSY